MVKIDSFYISSVPTLSPDQTHAQPLSSRVDFLVVIRDGLHIFPKVVFLLLLSFKQNSVYHCFSQTSALQKTLASFSPERGCGNPSSQEDLHWPRLWPKRPSAKSQSCCHPATSNSSCERHCRNQSMFSRALSGKCDVKSLPAKQPPG